MHSLTLAQWTLEVAMQYFFFPFYHLFFPCMSWGSFANRCDSKVRHLNTAFYPEGWEIEQKATSLRSDVELTDYKMLCSE